MNKTYGHRFIEEDYRAIWNHRDHHSTSEEHQDQSQGHLHPGKQESQDKITIMLLFFKLADNLVILLMFIYF